MINLMQGDCLELLRSVPDNSVDLVVTDPPYEMGSFGGGAFGNKNRAYRQEIKTMNNGCPNEVLIELRRIMKAVNIYIWCNKDQIRQYLNFFDDCYMDLLTWHKTNPTPATSNRWLSDTEYCVFIREKGVKVYGTYDTKHKYWVTPCNTADKKAYGHPTIKPLNIIENLIINSSIGGGVVLDPFMGSGTTGVACQKLGRSFIGMEINEEYFKIAESRIKGINEQIELNI